MIVTHEITIDLQNRKGVPRVDATQDDRYTRDIAISLMSGTEPWEFPSDAVTVIRYSKSDGVGGVYDTMPDGTAAWHAEGNVLTLDLAPQVLTVPGAVMLSATVSRGEEILHIFSVAIQVLPKVEAFSTESVNYYNVAAFLPGPVTAREGQFLRVAEVDETGRVLAVEAAQVTLEPGMGQEPGETDIPRLFFGEALPATKDEAIMPFRYVSDTLDFSGWCKTKAQGNSSMSYPKKNQTVKLYADEACSQKKKLGFRNWGPQNKFCCKANWIDLTHARNVVSARLWGDVIRSREEYDLLPEKYRASPNQGAVDGFPVKVYAGGIYQGRYTLNIPKDAWMTEMDDSLDSHCILCGENYVSGCFRAEAKIDGSDWTDEVHDSVPASILTRWNEVIEFVRNSTDEEFTQNIGQYFYLDSLIDYHLFGLMSCGLDAYGKNQLYMTYDGQKWIAGMYDMDSTWGLWWNGGAIKPTDYDRSEYQDFQDGSGNLLYIRLEQCFWEKLQERWQQLRTGALSMEHIILRFEAFTDIAPEELVKEDYATTTGGGAFTAIPLKSTCNVQQIRNFAAARHSWCDDYVASLTPTETVSCTGISLNYMSLTLNAGDVEVLTATVTPEGCTDPILWESSAEEVATVRNGTVTALGNGTTVITAICGSYSATMEITVKGGTEAVNCAGISLSEQTLVFTSAGTQTLTAAVTPEGCTDPITWESSDETVVTVDEGAVTAVGNGSAVVSAICGSFSAQCSVSVSGLAENLLLGKAWYVGEIMESSGEINDSVSAANYTDMIDISEYSLTILRGVCDGCNTLYSRIVFYDENMGFLSFVAINAYNVIPAGAKYMRISMYGASGKALVLEGSKENLWDVLEHQEGGYAGGSYNAADTPSGHIRIGYESGMTVVSTGAWGVAYLDEEDGVLSFTTLVSGHRTVLAPPEGTKTIAVCASDSAVGVSAVCCIMEQTGSSVIA